MRAPIEDRLTESLRRNAARVDVPAPPDLRAAAEARGTRRARTRGVVAVLGSAALVAAIVAVPQVWQRDDREAPPVTPSRSTAPTPSPALVKANTIDDLRRGASPRVPYIEDRVLHRGAEGRPLPGLTDLVAAGRALLVKDASGWHQLDRPPLVGVVGRPALSPDGRYLVHASTVQTSGVVPPTALTAYDLRDGMERIGVHVVTSDSIDPEVPFRLYGVDSSGRVYFRQPTGFQGETAGPMVWWPADERVATLAFGWEGDRVLAVGANELLVAHAGGNDGYVGPTVSDGQAAAVKKRWPVTSPERMALSPGGSTAFQAGAILDLEGTTKRLPLALAQSLSPEFLAFESDKAVLVHVREGEHQAIVRCSTQTGACELAQRLHPSAEAIFATNVPIDRPAPPAAAFEAWSGDRYLDVPEFEGLMPGTVAWPVAPGEHVAMVGGGDGATLFPFEKVGRSTDNGRTWQVYDVQKPDGAMPYLGGGAVVLPDGRMLVVIEAWSDDQPGGQAARHHGLFFSDGDDWSRYSPHKPTFAPSLGDDTVQEVAISVDGQTIGVRTAQRKVYLSRDDAESFQLTDKAWPEMPTPRDVTR